MQTPPNHSATGLGHQLPATGLGQRLMPTPGCQNISTSSLQKQYVRDYVARFRLAVWTTGLGQKRDLAEPPALVKKKSALLRKRSVQQVCSAVKAAVCNGHGIFAEHAHVCLSTTFV